MTKLDFLFFDAGGGHRAAATALRLVIEQQQRPWEVRLVNLQELLDPLDVARKWFGVRLQDVYNLFLQKRWTLGSPQLLRVLQALIRLYHRDEVRLLEEYWRASRPDLVVSFIPHFNRALYESLARACPKTPFVTVLTDLADYPPHFWIERQRQYFVCGTARAVEQALALGHEPERVFRVSGMILHPRFYQPMDVDRKAERRRLGLDPSRPTGLVLFGGQGSAVMPTIVRRLDGSDLDLQLIAICGHNDALRRQLTAMPTRISLFVEGFTDRVPYYMYLSDFFIGKPGPGSISEALAMKLPVVVECNAWTLPQERYNAEWILEHGVGCVVRSFRAVAATVAELLQPGKLAEFRARAAALNNRAVFEIPDILARILAAGP
ncbi:MAG: glycosyltransferase [Bryobacterales bacterium]|nr:galactosyldiacylglycerol synthase [Bryobacteraceae bacterium]MDW8354554.1 glycosyltransferase [Bryobacterales bacterium]